MVLRRNVYLIFLFLWQFVPVKVSGQVAVDMTGDVSNLLVQTGFEDVAVMCDGDALYINYSDNIYRGPVRGAFEVFRLLLDELKTDKSIHLLLQEDCIPQVALVLQEDQVVAYLNKTLSLAELMSSVRISYDTDEYGPVFKGIKRENHSAGKIDLVLYPQITLNNSWMDKLYGVIFNIAPAVEVGLWKGASFTGQVIFPIWNNMTGEMDYVRPGMLLFRQEYRFPKNVFMAFNIGNFNASRMGADLSFRYIPAHDRWEVGINGGLTGSSTFYSGKWELSEWRRFSGAVTFRYNEPFYNLQFDLTGQRYIYGDYGVRLDCTRHFGEVSVGLYGMLSGGEPNGGFHLAVPFPGKKRMKRRAVRLGLPEYFDWEYEAQSGNEYFARHLGRSYETRPDENRSQRYYNPSYLKEMLIKLASER
ncbi:MAG: YjbH domain-containing protein [Tannerella sp.]|jgi:hypothetical protein|nr:YjbH domain-containing protein [Tannerella sp.]